MKKYIYTGISVLLIASVLVFFNQAYASIVLIDSSTSKNSNFGLNNTRYYVGQSFTNTNSVTLDSVVVYLGQSGAGSLTGNMYANIYAETHTVGYGTDSVPTGSALATSDPIDVSTLTFPVSQTFSFSGANRITLSASTYYVMEIYYTNGQATYYPTVAIQTSDVASGNNNTSVNGTTWVANATLDTYFYVYGDNSGGTQTIVTGSGQKMIMGSAW